METPTNLLSHREFDEEYVETRSKGFTEKMKGGGEIVRVSENRDAYGDGAIEEELIVDGFGR